MSSYFWTNISAIILHPQQQRPDNCFDPNISIWSQLINAMHSFTAKDQEGDILNVDMQQDRDAMKISRTQTFNNYPHWFRSISWTNATKWQFINCYFPSSVFANLIGRWKDAFLRKTFMQLWNSIIQNGYCIIRKVAQSRVTNFTLGLAVISVFMLPVCTFTTNKPQTTT